jgi:choline dehydrogenase
MDQPNIAVLTGALALRILFDRRRATGIKFRYQGKTIQAEAVREVILSLGTIHTPKLLMQSGIGDDAELTRVDIPVFQALPGVGRNLHDHVAFGCSWENADKKPAPIPRSQTACFWKTSPELDAPQLLLLFAPRTRHNAREC